MIKIKGYPGLRRDPKTGAIININAGGVRPSVNERLDKLEGDVKEIMNMLKDVWDGMSATNKRN